MRRALPRGKILKKPPECLGAKLASEGSTIEEINQYGSFFRARSREFRTRVEGAERKDAAWCEIGEDMISLDKASTSKQALISTTTSNCPPK